MTYSDPDDDTPWVRANKGRCAGLIISGFVLGLGVAFTIVTTAGGVG